MEWWDCVHSTQLPSSGHDVVALVTVALDLYPSIVVAILNHDDQSGPALGEVVGGHALSALMTLA